MAQLGSPLFESYARNLRRIYWADFIDRQVEAARPAQFRASLVNDPLPDTDNLVNAYNYHRHRTSLPNDGH